MAFTIHILILGVGISCLSWFFWSLKRKVLELHQSEITWGVIKKIIEKNNDDGGVYTVPIVKFHTKSDEILQFETSQISKAFFSPRIGLKLLVLFNPKTRERIVLSLYSLFGIELIVLWVGINLTLIGFGYLIFSLSI